HRVTDRRIERRDWSLVAASHRERQRSHRGADQGREAIGPSYRNAERSCIAPELRCRCTATPTRACRAKNLIDLSHVVLLGYGRERHRKLVRRSRANSGASTCAFPIAWAGFSAPCRQ